MPGTQLGTVHPASEARGQAGSGHGRPGGNLQPVD